MAAALNIYVTPSPEQMWALPRHLVLSAPCIWPSIVAKVVMETLSLLCEHIYSLGSKHLGASLVKGPGICYGSVVGTPAD